MAQYDVFLNPEGRGFLVDVQGSTLDALRTTIVVPLDNFERVDVVSERLNPVFAIGGERMVLLTQFLFALPRSVLRDRRTSLAADQDRIKAALDMIFLGF